MSPSFILVLAAMSAWSLACIIAAAWLLRRPKGTPLQHDQYLSLVAGLSLAAAPWISLLTYELGAQSSMWGGVINLLVGLAVGASAWWQRRLRLQSSPAPASAVSFHEKSLRLMIATLIGVYAVYAFATWYYPSLAVPLFLGAGLLFTLLSIVGHIVIALTHLPLSDLTAPHDERDRAASRQGKQWAYPVLSVGMWVVPTLAVLGPSVMVLLHTAFAFIVLAQLAVYAGQWAFYRRGGHA